MGPRKDVVGMFRQAALREGLKFGVSEHLRISYKWFAVSHGSDETGPLAGVAYDGQDPANADLYHEAACAKFAKGELQWGSDGIPASWRQHWLLRIQDLVDHYQPDLLYTDGALPFEEYGLRLVSHHYNESAKRNGGKVEAVYTSKRREDCEAGNPPRSGPPPTHPSPARAAHRPKAPIATAPACRPQARPSRP
jgi:alpha-L-fucosidase